MNADTESKETTFSDVLLLSLLNLLYRVFVTKRAVDPRETDKRNDHAQKNR